MICFLVRLWADLSWAVFARRVFSDPNQPFSVQANMVCRQASVCVKSVVWFPMQFLFRSVPLHRPAGSGPPNLSQFRLTVGLPSSSAAVSMALPAQINQCLTIQLRCSVSKDHFMQQFLFKCLSSVYVSARSQYRRLLRQAPPALLL